MLVGDITHVGENGGPKRALMQWVIFYNELLTWVLIWRKPKTGFK